MSHKRKVEDIHRLKKVYEATKHGYGPGVWYDENKGTYIRLDFSNSWLKKHCRRNTRRKLKKNISELGSERSLYKRLYDYWWELY